MNILRLSTLSLTLAVAVFALGYNPSFADKPICGDNNDQHCTHGDDEPSGGGKTLLFISDAVCGGATASGDSHGHVDWRENILHDPNFVHVHYKLQLKDVDPEVDILVRGNFDCAECRIGDKGCVNDSVDFSLCGSGENCPPNVITVKQNGQGGTSGDLRVPGCDAGETTTVWVRVDVDIEGESKTLRSTPADVVLPPNNRLGCDE